MKDSLESKMLLGFAIVLIALAAAYPVSLMIKKANNMEDALDPKELAALQVNVDISDTYEDIASGPAVTRTASRRVANRDVDTELLIPVRDNLKSFGEKDFNLVGRAPWALLTTVSANVDDVAVVKYIFSNPVVVNAFIERADVKPLITDPAKLLDAIKNEYLLSTFLNYDGVQAGLGNPKIVEAIATSRLMDTILQMQSAQYFIKNPRTAANFINQSPSLTALKANAALVAAVRNHPATKAVAPIWLAGAPQQAQATAKPAAKKTTKK